MNKREWFINAAISFDGKISQHGKQIELSSKEDWEVVHKFRNSIAAIVVGSNTIKVDNPTLKTKPEYLQKGTPIRHPIRVVLDRRGTCDPKSKVFQDQEEIPTIWVTNSNLEIDKVLKIDAVEIDKLIQEVNAICSQKEMEGDIMIEGGAIVINNFINSGLITRIRLYRAPLILKDGQPLFPKKLDQTLRVKSARKLGPGIEEIYKIE
jgi:riboflavin-specific deaminase-like protein